LASDGRIFCMDELSSFSVFRLMKCGIPGIRDHFRSDLFDEATRIIGRGRSATPLSDLPDFFLKRAATPLRNAHLSFTAHRLLRAPAFDETTVPLRAFLNPFLATRRITLTNTSVLDETINRRRHLCVCLCRVLGLLFFI